MVIECHDYFLEITEYAKKIGIDTLCTAPGHSGFSMPVDIH